MATRRSRKPSKNVIELSSEDSEDLEVMGSSEEEDADAEEADAEESCATAPVRSILAAVPTLGLLAPLPLTLTRHVVHCV